MEKHYDTRKDLIATFKQECDKNLEFLDNTYSAKKEFGFSSFDGPIPTIREYSSDQIPNVFWLIQRYSLSNSIIEISYGDRESTLEARIFYKDSKQMFALFEILRAADLEDSDIAGANWVLNKEFMHKTISALSASLQKHFDLIANPGKAIIDKALFIREEQMRHYNEDLRNHDLERARNMATEEFRNHNYKKVLELLSPFEDILSEADKMKVKLARKYSKRFFLF